MKAAQKQLDSEISGQMETNWELEHQNKRKADYEAQIAEIKKDILSIRTYLPMIGEFSFAVLAENVIAQVIITCIYSLVS